MPISQKIIDRISSTSVSQDVKDLMLKILFLEDRGPYRIESEYEKAINAYLSEQDMKEDAH